MIGKRWVAALLCFGVASIAVAQPKTIELDFPTWQAEEPGAGEYWTELIKAFEAKNPGVKVKKTQVPFREYADKMTVRFAASNPPDIVHLPSRNFLAFASQGWLAPLDDYAGKLPTEGGVLIFCASYNGAAPDNATAGVIGTSPPEGIMTFLITPCPSKCAKLILVSIDVSP